MKKLETLFHGTSKLEFLQSIIENGFHPSYANEYLFERRLKILMVSFSNIPLIEARSQVNYGEYFIGLNRSWGIKNGLHPVAYTFSNSSHEINMNKLIEEAAIGQSLSSIKHYIDKGIQFELDGDSLKRVKKLLEYEVNDEIIDLLKEIFGNVFSKTLNLVMYFKHYKVTHRNKEIYAYNDREWRYIPNGDIKKVIFEKDASGQELAQYSKWNGIDKPHFTDISLGFDLDDISYIVVKKKNEVSRITEALFDKFNKEETLKKITTGEITILPLEKILSDL